MNLIPSPFPPETVPTPFPRETNSSPGTLDYFVEEIGRRWQASTASILEVASLCVEAMSTLNAGQRLSLKARLRLNKGTLSKLVKIGQDKRLQHPAVLPHLPSHYTMLYEIAKLSDGQLRTAIEMGVIHPDMKRGDLAVGPSSEPWATIIAKLVLCWEVSDDRMVSFQRRIEDVLLDFPEFGVESKKLEWFFRSVSRPRQHNPVTQCGRLVDASHESPEIIQGEDDADDNAGGLV